MGLFSFFKGVINKVFHLSDVTTRFGVPSVLSQDMESRIGLWAKCYAGKAPWLDKNVQSLKLEKSIVREFANVALNEMESSVSNEKLNEIYSIAMRNLNENFQRGMAMGAMVIKPIDESHVQYISQEAFIPVEYDSNQKLIKVIFPDIKKIGNRYYTRLEYHSLSSDKGLEIINKAYVSASQDVLGNEISLSSIPEWANISPYTGYPLMQRPIFGYYRNPIDNTIDGSGCGVSIFECALHMIKKTDIQFGRLDWEFESGERAIHVDITALRPENRNGKVKLETPKLNERLYRGMDVGVGDNAELFKEFSPAFRDSNIINGMEEYKRNIEFQVGLSYGDISNPQSVEKTATEIKSAKKRKYNTVTAIQENLKDCLDDLVYALAFYNGLATTSYEFVCNFKDSILVDEETERAQDRQDVSMGAMALWEYRCKWYNESEETAKKMVAGSEADVME